MRWILIFAALTGGCTLVSVRGDRNCLADIGGQDGAMVLGRPRSGQSNPPAHRDIMPASPKQR